LVLEVLADFRRLESGVLFSFLGAYESLEASAGSVR
jgi:hypothetical protein